MSTKQPFWLHEQHDRESASDGLSRYGAYLASYRKKFLDDSELTTDRLTFASAAWRIAHSPIMSPSFVRTHPRIQSAETHWDDEYRLAVDVVLAMPNPWPAHPTSRYRARGWVEDRVWGGFSAPESNSVLALLPSLLVRVPVKPDDLVTPEYVAGVPAVNAAKDAVLAICQVLNPLVSGVLDNIE